MVILLARSDDDDDEDEDEEEDDIEDEAEVEKLQTNEPSDDKQSDPNVGVEV